MTSNEMEAARSPRTVRLLTAVLLVATFAAGTVMGAGLFRWGVPGRPPMPPPMLAPLPVEELDLTPRQWEEVRAIVERRRPELEAILRETYPKVRKINEEIEADVRVVLTPEQSARLDRIRARRPPPPAHSHGPVGPPPHRGWMPPPPHFSGQPPPPPMSQPGPPFEAPPR